MHVSIGLHKGWAIEGAAGSLRRRRRVGESVGQCRMATPLEFKWETNHPTRGCSHCTGGWSKPEENGDFVNFAGLEMVLRHNCEDDCDGHFELIIQLVTRIQWWGPFK